MTSCIEKKNELVSFGFTLIELLVVISIIGVLATLLLANYSSTRERARDSQRKSDLRNIQTALRMYYNDYNKYPDATNDGKIKGCGLKGTDICNWGSAFSTTSATYMNILPKDPSLNRRYNYQSTGEDYTLSACLENRADDKCKVGVTCTWLSGVPGCVYEVKP